MEVSSKRICAALLANLGVTLSIGGLLVAATDRAFTLSLGMLGVAIAIHVVLVYVVSFSVLRRQRSPAINVTVAYCTVLAAIALGALVVQTGALSGFPS